MAMSGIFVMHKLFCKVAQVDVINCITLKKVNQNPNFYMESGYMTCTMNTYNV